MVNGITLTAPQGVSNSDPTPLDPNLLSVEIMGVLAYFKMLNFFGNANGYSPFITQQMQWCKDQISIYQTEEANLPSEFVTILNDAPAQMSNGSGYNPGFDAWLDGEYANLGGSGSTIFDFLKSIQADPGVTWDPNNSQNLVTFTAMSGMLMNDLANTKFGQQNGADSYFSGSNRWHPTDPNYFPQDDMKAMIYFLYMQAGEPAPGTLGWQNFLATDCATVFFDMLNPANTESPSSNSQYGENAWSWAKQEVINLFNGQSLPDGGLDQAFGGDTGIINYFNQEFFSS